MNLGLAGLASVGLAVLGARLTTPPSKRTVVFRDRTSKPVSTPRNLLEAEKAMTQWTEDLDTFKEDYVRTVSHGNKVSKSHPFSCGELMLSWNALANDVSGAQRKVLNAMLDPRFDRTTMIFPESRDVVEAFGPLELTFRRLQKRSARLGDLMEEHRDMAARICPKTGDFFRRGDPKNPIFGH